MTRCKGKNQVTFFMVSFKINLFSKISYMHWLFWAIYHIKKGYGTSFYCNFFAYLFHKNVSDQIPYLMTKFWYWREWPSRLKHCSLNSKVFGSNPTRHSAGFFLTIIWPTLGHFQRNNRTKPMLVTAFSTLLTWSTPEAL